MPRDAPDPNANPPQILIVDRCADLRAVVRVFLEQSGFRVLEAEDPGSASRILLARTPPDLILIDPLSGPWHCRDLIQNTDLPVVTYSIRTRFEPDLESKISARFEKPCDLNELGEAIKNLVPRTGIEPVRPLRDPGF